MWQPNTWQDVEALIGTGEETSSLDFKGDLPSNEKLAKAIAAMSVDGGVVLIGVAEKSSRAERISPVELNGLEETIRQVAFSRISPPPPLELLALRENPEDEKGVMAIVVPASPSAPHYTNDRFYRRHGTTTEHLSEAEIDRLYRLRRHADPEDVPVADLMSGPARILPGISEHNVNHSSEKVGLVQVAARMRGDAKHADDPRLADALRRTVYDLEQWSETRRLRTPKFVKTVGNRGWQAGGVNGWFSGSEMSADVLEKQFRSSLVLTYPAHLYMRLTVPLFRGHETEFNDYPCAFELDVVSEILGFLRLAGQWFSEYPSGGRIQVGVNISGFDEATSYHASQAMPNLGGRSFGAADGIRTSVDQSAQDLRETPELAAHDLIDRWLVSFYDGNDLVDHFASRE